MKKFLRITLSLVLAVILFATAMPIYAVEDTTVEEIEELREENVKHFKMNDGTYKAVVYSEPVHRRDADGNWQDIDNTLSADSESNYVTSDGRVKFSRNVKKSGGSLFELSENGYKISLSLIEENIKSASARIKNHGGKRIPTVFDSEKEKLEKLKEVDNLTRVRYNDITEDVDIEYEIYSNNIKESIIVNSVKDSYVYKFELKLNKMTATLNEDGEISLSDEKTGEVKYIMPAPFMFDDSGALSTDVYYTLTQSGKYKYELTVTASAEWINEKDRDFPVTIDPTIEIDSSYGEAYVSSTNPNANYGSPSDGRLFVSSTQRIFLKFDLPTIPEGYCVTGAYLIMHFYFYASTYGNMSIGAYSVPYSWNENTITWNNSVASYQSAESSAAILSTNDISSGMTATESLPVVLPFDVTEAVNDWYMGEDNNGIAIKRLSGMTGAIAFNGYNSGSSFRPILELTYQYDNIIINGTFYIENVKDYTYIQDGTTNASLQIFSGDTNQKWVFTYLNNGYHKITASNSGKALTAPSTLNVSVALSDYNSSYNQMWIITQDANGFYRLLPRSNTSCYLSRINNTVSINNSPTGYMDRWEITTCLDYALAYVGDSDHDSRMPVILEQVKGNLRTNAETVGFGDIEVTVEKALLLLSESRMFSFLGHGTSTSISLSDGNLTINDINSLSNSALSNLEFVYLAACDTGMGKNNGNNLVNAIHSKEVSVLGFVHPVDQEETIVWTEAFMESLSGGNTVEDAMGYADEYIREEYEFIEYTTSLDYRHLKGDSHIKPFA